MSEHATAVFDLPQHEASPVRCVACANRACSALGGVPGVARVECDPLGASVKVEFDPGRVTQDDLVSQMDRFGLELAEVVRHAAWRVTGLD